MKFLLSPEFAQTLSLLFSGFCAGFTVTTLFFWWRERRQQRKRLTILDPLKSAQIRLSPKQTKQPTNQA